MERISTSNLPPGLKSNFISLYERSTPTERSIGLQYYDLQRAKIAALSTSKGQVLLSPSVAAFAALSPNNSERTNYIALSIVLDMAAKVLPLSHKVPAFPDAKRKAIDILINRLDPEQVLGGRKVRAFYFNTLDPDNESNVTIDGHMYNIWTNTKRRISGKEFPHINESTYKLASDDLRAASASLQISAPRLQSILWLTWKRIHNILTEQSFAKKQLEFKFE